MKLPLRLFLISERGRSRSRVCHNSGIFIGYLYAEQSTDAVRLRQTTSARKRDRKEWDDIIVTVNALLIKQVNGSRNQGRESEVCLDVKLSISEYNQSQNLIKINGYFCFFVSKNNKTSPQI